MRLIIKRGIQLILLVLTLLLLVSAAYFLNLKWQSKNNLSQLGPEASVRDANGFSYRDLNKNGKLDPYEDSRESIATRVTDLIRQMSLEEKAGTLFITMAGIGADGDLSETPRIDDFFSWLLPANSKLLVEKKMHHFNIVQSPSAIDMIRWHNTIQKAAERTRLGIPVTIASDPRHGAIDAMGASIPTPDFSGWPTPLGMAATRDSSLVKEFASIASAEYRAVGIRLALSPMADLATEPRWARINGTFGEDAYLSASLTKAYIEGFQGDSLNKESVACMTKHFPGAGPQENGEDAHFAYGKNQVYPGNAFDYHLIPFEKGAFPANTAQIMPYYGVPVGQDYEAVGFGFNKKIISEVLRKQYGFDGVVCTDWGIISDLPVKPASAYGVESLSEKERALKVIQAGCDMFGGEMEPQWIIDLVKEGKINTERLDLSVRRILRDKFKLGLFDNPYLPESNVSLLNRKENQIKGIEAQQKALVLLKNKDEILPLKKGVKVYIEGFENPESIQPYAKRVSRPEEADFVLLKLPEPFEPRSEFLMERFMKQGRLYFLPEEQAPWIKLLQLKPGIVVFSLNRPPLLSEISKVSSGLIADFLCHEKVIFDLIFGAFNPTGSLPIEIPSSQHSVEKQKEDLPYDSAAPLYPFGWGLSYKTHEME
ncbi:MAG: glycoside hydrolase family 3 N-terminal domain-containing protein [Flavobacteriaceae bacterium]